MGAETKAGDIAQCRFPEDKLGARGPKDRPALVIEVEEDSEDETVSIVRVAYGTSQEVEKPPGEFTTRATDPTTGLGFDTKFDLANTVRVPFDAEWFAPSPNRCFGDHPKRASLTSRMKSFRPPPSKQRKRAVSETPAPRPA